MMYRLGLFPYSTKHIESTSFENDSIPNDKGKINEEHNTGNRINAS
jgi:hypothetical protein